MRHTDVKRQKAVVLYRDHDLSLSEIRQKIGVSEKTLMRWLKAAKVKMRSPTAQRYPKEKILDHLRKGKKRNWICEKFGCSPKYVSQLAKDMKVEKKAA